MKTAPIYKPLSARLFPLVLIFMAGCGGGSSDPDPCLQTVRIQLFGDSTMWGYLSEGGGVRASTTPESALQALMDERYGKGSVSVSTRAVSGTTSKDLLNGTDGLNAPWPQSVNANIVVVNHGINDVAYSVTPDAYKANLLKLANVGAVFVLQTPLPVSTATVDYASAMREVATDVGAPIIDARAYAESFGVGWWKYAPDGVHLTSEGYQLLAENAMFPVLSASVSKLLCSK